MVLLLTLAACAAPVPEGPCGAHTPAERVFDTFWAHLDRRYAVFPERLDGDWWALGAEQCDRLGRRASSDELFEAMVRLARNLDDGHLTLRAPDLGRSADGWVSVYPHYRQLYRLELLAEEATLDGRLAWAARDWVAWGRVGDLGYVSLTSMDGLSRGGSERGDVDAAHAAMDRVLADLGDTRGLVVDVRANEGGWDRVSLAFASRFAGERAVAWTEQRRDGPAHDDLGPPVEVHVDPTPDAYDGPVVLLTSGGTFSAAETFVLAMRTRPGVTVLGEPTSGHFSDMLDGRLPNGWRFTYSGERYLGPGGLDVEAVGAPVDVWMPFDAEAVRDGRDPQLDAALERL